MSALTGLKKTVEILVYDASTEASATTPTIDVSDTAYLNVQLTGAAAWDGTITFEGTLDGTNWTTIQGERRDTGVLITTYTGTTSFQVQFDVSGIDLFRLNLASRTVGNVTARARGMAN